jgi:probable O-glycosylation ligase (exosortase A-associated)
MLRTIFTLILTAYGIRHAIRGPFYALLFYLWIAYFRPESFVWEEGIVAALPLSFTAAVWVLALSVLSGKAFRIDLRLGLLIVFVLHALASSLASPDVVWSMANWNIFMRSAVITYLMAVLVTDVKKLRLAVLVMVVSLGFEATKQGWDHVIVAGGGKNYNAIPFLGDENGVAVGMFMLVPLAAALMSTEARRWARGSLLFITLGVMFRGISTYSRGGFLTMLAIGGMYVLRTRRKMMALGAVAALGVGFLLVMDESFWDRMETIRPVDEATMVHSVTGEDASSLGRLHFWTVALEMANDRPVLGVGFNAFIRVYNDYDPEAGRFGINKAVHSSWFGVLAELGYVGLFLFVLQLGLALIACHRVRRHARYNDEAKAMLPFAVAVETALIAAMVGGTFVNFHYIEMLWHMIALSIAMNRMVAAQVKRAAVDQPVALPTPRIPMQARISARSMTP